MRMKSMLSAALTAAVLLGTTLVVRADEAKDKELQDKIAAVEKELAPIRSKANADEEVKAAVDRLTEAQKKSKK